MGDVDVKKIGFGIYNKDSLPKNDVDSDKSPTLEGSLFDMDLSAIQKETPAKPADSPSNGAVLFQKTKVTVTGETKPEEKTAQTEEVQVQQEAEEDKRDSADFYRKMAPHIEADSFSGIKNDAELTEKIKQVYPEADDKAIDVIKNYNKIEGDKFPKNISFPAELKTEKGTYYAYENDAVNLGEKMQYDDFKAHQLNAAFLKPGENLWKKTKEMYPNCDDKTVSELVSSILEQNGIKNAKAEKSRYYNFPGRILTSKGVVYAGGGDKNHYQSSSDYKETLADIRAQNRQAKIDEALEKAKTQTEDTPKVAEQDAQQKTE